MFCKFCGKQIEDNSKFCPECGKNLISGTNNHQTQDSNNFDYTKSAMYNPYYVPDVEPVKGSMKGKGCLIGCGAAVGILLIIFIITVIILICS